MQKQLANSQKCTRVMKDVIKYRREKKPQDLMRSFKGLLINTTRYIRICIDICIEWSWHFDKPTRQIKSEAKVERSSWTHFPNNANCKGVSIDTMANRRAITL